MLAVAAVAVALTTLVHSVWLNDAAAQPEGGGDTVRIAALKQADGRVQVALQERQADGSWGERQLPNQRFVPADAPTDRWLHSSELHTSGAAASAIHAPADEPEEALVCIVAHGSLDDYFWQILKGYARLAEQHMDANIRFVTSLDGAEQAGLIAQCSADGAAVIASTLADAEQVTPALRAAKQAGARIITFNSGAQFAEAAGAELHIALDDVGAGELAGRTFAEHGVQGAIACLLHEEQNVGLEQRCDALERTYTGGDVLRVALPEGADSDTVRETIAARLTDPDAPPINAVLALNGDTLFRAYQAVVQTADAVGRDIQVGSIGGIPLLGREPLAQRQRHVLFAINSMKEAQGYLVAAAIQMVHTFHQPPSFILMPTILAGVPFIYNVSEIRASAEELAAVYRAAAAIQALARDE